MTKSKRVWLALGAAAFSFAAGAAAAQGEIKIGEINSYSGLPAFTEPYRKGWQLASRRSMRPAASAARRSRSSRRTTAASRPTR